MEVFKKAFLAGVGALSLSKEQAKRIAAQLIAQGKMKEKEGRQLVDDMLRKAEATKKDLERTINTKVSSAYGKINVATQEQLKKMERRIHELERDLAKKNQAAGRAQRTRAKRPTKTKTNNN